LRENPFAPLCGAPYIKFCARHLQQLYESSHSKTSLYGAHHILTFALGFCSSSSKGSAIIVLIPSNLTDAFDKKAIVPDFTCHMSIHTHRYRTLSNLSFTLDFVKLCYCKILNVWIKNPSTSQFLSPQQKRMVKIGQYLRLIIYF